MMVKRDITSLVLCSVVSMLAWGFESGSGFISVSAFVTQRSSPIPVKPKQISFSRVITSSPSASSTLLFERRWNFNEGQGPFGLKKNAEIWNGRVAQMCFIAVLLQEAFTGKGVIQGINEGDPFFIACLVATMVVVGGLTAFLAIKGADNYVDDELGRK